MMRFGTVLSGLYSEAPGCPLDSILLEPLLYQFLRILGLRGCHCSVSNTHMILRRTKILVGSVIPMHVCRIFKGGLLPAVGGENPLLTRCASKSRSRHFL